MKSRFASPDLQPIAGLFLICLLMFAPLLFSGEIINATDILTQQYFWNVFVKENLFTDPSFQTWMPYINGGTAFGGGLNLLFRPISFVTLLLLPVHIALSYEVVLYLLLMGISMYLYMRELELSPWGSFLAALFLMLNGQIVSLINAGHVNKLGTIAFTPLVFWALERALKRKTLNSFLLTGVMLALQFWQTHIQISFYTCIAVGLYFLIRVGILYKKERNIKQLSLLVVFALLMVVVFLLLSAVELLPWISFAQVSDRAEGVSYEFATSWSMPLEELVTYFIPNFFGFRRLNYIEDENIIPYWGRMPFTQTGHYFGLLPLLFIVLAICFVRNKHVLTLGILALIVLLLGMGKYFPSYKLLYDYVPGFNKFRVPQMILFLFAFTTSALAGFGAEWFFAGWSKSKEKRLRIFLLIGIAIVMFFWLLIVLFPHIESMLISQFNETLLRKDGTPEIAKSRLQNIFQGILQFSIGFGIVLFVLGLRLAAKIHLKWILLAVIIVYLGDIWLFNEKYIDTIPLESSHYISENDAIRYCKENPGLYRIFPTTNQPVTYSTFNKYVYHHLFSISGYEAVGVQYYNDFLQQMALGTPLVDLLNIKYIILSKNVELDGEAVEVGKVVGPYKVVMDSDAVLLENLNVLPRAYPVHNAYLANSKEEAFSTMLQPTFNPREFVVLEEHPQVSMAQEVVPSSQSTVEMTHYLTRTITMKASMATDGFIVLSEKFYPGWKAYVDGKETKIYKANYTLQAIFASQGEHEIQFFFQPTQFLRGLIITLLTGVGLLAVYPGRRYLAKHFLLAVHQKIEHTFQTPPVIHAMMTCAGGLIVFGIILHLVKYVHNHSFTVDEVGTVLAMFKHPFSKLLQPLPYGASAPVGFVAIQKVLVLLFGDHDYVWRLFPLFSRLMSIALFYYVVSHFFKKSAAIALALLFFVFSDRLLSFSVIAYQYSSDVFFALLIYAIALYVRSKGVNLPRTFLLGISGALIVWCSFPVVFIMAGVAVSMLISSAKRKDWKTFLHLSFAYGMWAFSFLLMYRVFLRDLNNETYLLELSARNFAPFPPRSLADVITSIKAFVDYMGYTVGWSASVFHLSYSRSLFDMLPAIIQQVNSPLLPFDTRLGLALFGVSWIGLYGAAALMFFIGAFSFFKRNKAGLALLILPACFLILTSRIFKLPLRHRLALFLFPAILICLVEGLGQVQARINTRSVFLGWTLVGIFLIYPVFMTSYQVLKPGSAQHVKPIIHYLKEHKQPGDSIYIYYGANQLFEYYSKQFGGFENADIIFGIRSREDWNKYIQDLEQLRGRQRVWILFSHIVGYEEIVFLSYLDDNGRRLDSFQGINTAVYLYDLSR